MTSNEIEKLKRESGRGITAIYKVANQLQRAPYSWEVVYYTLPKGRRKKYHTSHTVIQKNAYIEWNRVGALSEQMQIEEQKGHMDFVYIFWRDQEMWHDCYGAEVAEIADKFCGDYASATWDEDWQREKLVNSLFIDSQNVMLHIVKRLKDIIYGG